jgi:hypothetical protein
MSLRIYTAEAAKEKQKKQEYVLDPVPGTHYLQQFHARAFLFLLIGSH